MRTLLLIIPFLLAADCRTPELPAALNGIQARVLTEVEAKSVRGQAIPERLVTDLAAYAISVASSASPGYRWAALEIMSGRAGVTWQRQLGKAIQESARRADVQYPSPLGRSR